MILKDILALKEDQARQFDNCVKGPYPDKEWAKSQLELFRTELNIVRNYISGNTTELRLPKCQYVDIGICTLDHEDIRGDCIWKKTLCPYRYIPAPKQAILI